ncbi:flavoprotein [Halobacillus fulvus]|nr:flavoprotein [Halobacillus fulvus]
MDFLSFFEEFKERAGNHDLDYLKTTISEGFQAREVRQGEAVDYGYTESVQGWKEAFEHFENFETTWTYTDHSITQTKDNEWMAAFWVSLTIDGEQMPTSNLFFDTFKKEAEGWKLVRSYIEAGVQNPLSITSS